MALRYASEQGLKTVGLVNVDHSTTIAREADLILPTRAGPEIGVASTKAFTAQLTVLLALAISLARVKGTLSLSEAEALHEEMKSLPSMVGKTLSLFDDLRLTHELARAQSCLYLGRDSLLPIALEGALKLKELSYIHAEGFAAGEMKHGPIALIEDGLPVVSLLGADELSPKVISNLKEAQARGAKIILLAADSVANEVDFASHICRLPDCSPYLMPFILTIPTQILAYLTASEKGTDVDQPRNLAKSVTVE